MKSIMSMQDIYPPAKRPGLYERKHLRTQRAIRRAALTLFTKQGFDNTTIEQIAYTLIQPFYANFGFDLCYIGPPRMLSARLKVRFGQSD